MPRRAAVISFVLAALVSQGVAAASHTHRGPAKDALEGGTHYRFSTGNGPVHVWKPGRYDKRSAGIVLYLHGFYTNVDEAFREHRLAAQFRAGGQNALYVVPEAPSSGHEPTQWPRLSELLDALRAHGIDLPSGPVVAIGHSGSYRVIAGWLGAPRLEHVILVDALYGNEDEFGRWIDGKTAAGEDDPTHGPRRLTLVVQGTEKWAKPFVQARPRAVICNRVPSRYEDFSKRERAAKLLYIRSQYGHMELITDGQTLPVVLRLTPLRHLKKP